jgi:hypothetical protein
MNRIVVTARPLENLNFNCPQKVEHSDQSATELTGPGK